MTVLGADKLMRDLSNLSRNAKRRVADALESSAAEMFNHAVVNIQKNSGTGRKYKRGKRTHVASSPGEYPNSDSGELVRSGFWEKRGELTAVWGFAAKHALPLEVGTSKMAARPIARPTFNALYSRASDRVMAAVAAVVKEAHG